MSGMPVDIKVGYINHWFGSRMVDKGLIADITFPENIIEGIRFINR